MQARYLEAVVSVPSGALRLINIYLPNGNGSPEKYVYKLAWMTRLKERIKTLLAERGDRWSSPATSTSSRRRRTSTTRAPGWTTRCSRPQTRAHFQSLVNLGLTDAFRACHDEPHRYTFWDYQAGAFQKNQGLRIDHLLLSPQAADRLQSCEIDASPRSWEKPSDHVPIFIELAV